MVVYEEPMFWLIIGICGFLGLFAILRAVPFVGKVLGKINRKTWIIVGIVGFLVFSGTIAGLNFGSLAPGKTSSQGSIINVQQTTTFASGTGAACTITETQPGVLYDVRCNDADVNESSGAYEVGTGIFTIRRGGALAPESIPVTCVVPGSYENETASTGLIYNILEMTDTNIPECYLNGASSGAAATTSSPKMTGSLPFAEGVDTAYLGIALEVDSAGIAALDQYSSKDIVIRFGNQAVTFRIQQMD